MEPSNDALQRGLEALRSEISAARAEAERRAETVERADEEASAVARRRAAMAAVGVVAVGAAVGGGLAVRAAGRAHPQSVAVPATAASSGASLHQALGGTVVPAATTTSGAAGSAARGGTAVAAAVSSPDAHLVARGESFWTVAQTVLARRLGSTPSDAQTASYWVKLLAANRSVVGATGNINIIYPGMVLTLPGSG